MWSFVLWCTAIASVAGVAGCTTTAPSTTSVSLPVAEQKPRVVVAISP